MAEEDRSKKELMTGPSNATPGLLEPGNIINIYNRPITKAPAGPHGIQGGMYTEGVEANYPLMKAIPGQEYGDYPGSTSSTLSKSFNINGKETLLPTVVGGKFLSDAEAINRFKQTGEHLGMFADSKSADDYAGKLHLSQQEIGNYYGKTSDLKPEPPKKSNQKKRAYKR